MIAAQCDRCARKFHREIDEEWKLLCFECWLATKAQGKPRREVVRSDAEAVHAELVENLPALLQLAHPDKHGGSAVANRLTAWLLEIRRQARERCTER